MLINTEQFQKSSDVSPRAFPPPEEALLSGYSLLRFSTIQPRLHEEQVAKLCLTGYTNNPLSFTFCQQLSNRYCLVRPVSLLLYFIRPLLSTDRTHWPDSDNRYFTLEATGYALLALIKGGHMNEAMAPFRWLNEHRDIGGSYGSTQVKTKKSKQGIEVLMLKSLCSQFLLIEMTY